MKIQGKDLEFWFDGKEYPVISVSLSEEFDSLDATDTSTAGDGKDFEVSKANRQISVEAYLYSPDGAEINSGTLVSGKKYRVTAKNTVLSAYEIGQLFVASGTETMSTTDKVVPIGNPLTGNTLSFTFNGNSVPLTSADISIKYDTIDATDSTTTGDATETIVSRAERGSKVEGIVRSNAVDLLTTNPTAQNTVLTFNTGQTITGQATPFAKEITDETTGFAKVSYSIKWRGNPTEVALGLPNAVEKPFRVVLRRGATTNKQYTGNAVVTEKSISSEIKGLTKVTYTLMVNGTVSYAVAN